MVFHYLIINIDNIFLALNSISHQQSPVQKTKKSTTRLPFFSPTPPFLFCFFLCPALSSPLLSTLENTGADANAAPAPAPPADVGDDMMGGGNGGGDDFTGGAPAPVGVDDFGGMMGGGGGGGGGGDMSATMSGGDDFGGMMGDGAPAGGGGGGGSDDMGAPVDMGLSSMPAVEAEGPPPSAPPPAVNGNGNGTAALEASSFASTALAEWKADQQRLIAEKEAEEVRELQSIREEAQAERDLVYSQREKQLQAVYKSNRERQAVSVETSAGQTGWEAVLALVSDENLVPDRHTDLSRFKQMLTRLKHQVPLTRITDLDK